MIGGPFRKILLAILAIPAVILILISFVMPLGPLIGIFFPQTGAYISALPLFLMIVASGCATKTAALTPLPNSPWIVEERWRHCSALDRSPIEIVAINAKKHQEIRIAMVDYSSNYGPGFGLDDRGQMVVVVPKRSTVSDRRDEVLGLKVIYKSYDGYDDAVRKSWIAWTADPKDPAFAAWYRRQPDFPASEPAVTK